MEDESAALPPPAPPVPPAPPAPPVPPAPPPRAFAQGTGVLLQMVGGVMFLTSCCVCSSAFLWDGELWSPQEAALASEQGKVSAESLYQMVHDPAKFGLMLMVMFTTVGGLALAVFGLGLQSDKLRAGGAAVITNILLLLLLLLAGVSLWRGGAGAFTLLWHAGATGVMLILLCFIIPAWRQVQAHPPSGQLHTVPADYDPEKDMEHESVSSTDD